MVGSKKKSLYDLTFEEGESCFQAFDPSDYEEKQPFKTNKAFKSQEANFLQSYACTAIHFLTRMDELHLQCMHEIYTFETKALAKERALSGSLLPVFHDGDTGAYSRTKEELNEIVRLCCKELRQTLNRKEWKTLTKEGERSGNNDGIMLFDILEKKFPQGYKTTYDHTYHAGNLLAGFALWKIDKALTALSEGCAHALANISIDIERCVSISEQEYEAQCSKLLESGIQSLYQSVKGRKRHRRLGLIKEEAIKIYKNGQRGGKWSSVSNAADSIYKQHHDIFEGEQAQALRTIRDWLTDFDPEGKYSKFPRKKNIVGG